MSGKRFRHSRVRQYNASNGRQKGEAQRRKCPNCFHHKMWGTRGVGLSKYKNKCCKCGHEVLT